MEATTLLRITCSTFTKLFQRNISQYQRAIRISMDIVVGAVLPDV